VSACVPFGRCPGACSVPRFVPIGGNNLSHFSSVSASVGRFNPLGRGGASRCPKAVFWACPVSRSVWDSNGAGCFCDVPPASVCWRALDAAACTARRARRTGQPPQESGNGTTRPEVPGRGTGRKRRAGRGGFGNCMTLVFCGIFAPKLGRVSGRKYQHMVKIGLRNS